MSFYEILKSNLSIPVIYDAHKEPVKAPFIAYIGTGQDRVLADNKIYVKENTYRLEYYFNQKNTDIEDEIEEILQNLGYIYTKSGDITITSENMYVIHYEV